MHTALHHSAKLHFSGQKSAEIFIKVNNPDISVQSSSDISVTREDALSVICPSHTNSKKRWPKFNNFLFSLCKTFLQTKCTWHWIMMNWENVLMEICFKQQWWRCNKSQVVATLAPFKVLRQGQEREGVIASEEAVGETRPLRGDPKILTASPMALSCSARRRISNGCSKGRYIVKLLCNKFRFL